MNTKKRPLMTNLLRLQIWREKAPVVVVPNPGASDSYPGQVRLISRWDPLLAYLKERLSPDAFGVHRKELTRHPLPRRNFTAVAVCFVDPWIDAQHQERLRMKEEIAARRQAHAEAERRPSTQTLPDPTPSSGESSKRWYVCDLEEVEARIKAVDGSDRPERTAKKTHTLQMLADRAVRYLPLVTREHIEAVRSMAQDFPNFSPLIEEIARYLAFRMRLGETVEIPSVLIHGVPGIGKSRFVKVLAEVLGYEYFEYSFAQITAGFVLTGSSSHWSGADIGKLAAAVINTPANKVPLILFDEVDKAKSEGVYPADTALLQASEPSTAQRFRDEYLDVAIDIRPMAIILAGNRLERMKPEIRSRYREIHVQAPTKEQMPAIIRSIDRALRSECPKFDQVFQPLSDQVIDLIAATPPRDASRRLADAYARCSIEAPFESQALELLPQHFEPLQPDKKAKPEIPSPDTSKHDAVQQAYWLMMLTLWDGGWSTRH